jgi:hypothetical protein
LPAGGLVDAALARLGVEPGWRVFALWREVCGPTIGARAQPDRLRGEVLYVRVPNASWGHHLAFVKAELLERLRARTQLRLSDLRFVVGELDPAPAGGPAAQTPPRRAVRPEPPLTPAAARAVESAACAVADPELREALRALGLRVVRD